MKKNILLIAYVFPPIAYGGTHRTVRLCKYLARMGYNVTVLTINIQRDIHNDFSLLDKLPEDVSIERTKTIDFWRTYQPIKKKILQNRSGRLLDKFLSKIIDTINKPDHMVFWVPFAIFKGMRLIRKKNINLVYTTSPPHSQHLVGMGLKKITSIPWVADFRDPILNNITAEDWGRFELYLNRHLETSIAKNADALIANTSESARNFRKRYGRANIHYIGNSYDPDDFMSLVSGKFNKFTIAHVGSIYAFRKADFLIEAIAEMSEKGLIHHDSFRVLFVGINNPELLELIERYKVEKYFKIEKMVSHEKALEIMLRSHLLLLIKGMGDNSKAQIPGKLFEYIGAGGKILYIGPEECDAAEIVGSLKTGIVAGASSSRIKQQILAKYKAFLNDSGFEVSLPGSVSHEKYSSAHMAKKMSIVFNEVLQSNAPSNSIKQI